MGAGNGRDYDQPADYVMADRGATIGGSAQINNTLSTPVFVVLVLALFIASLVSAAAIMLAVSAKDAAVIAEREARLAQNRYDTLNVDVKVLRGLLEQSGINVPQEATR